MQIISEDNAIILKTINNRLILGLSNDGQMLSKKNNYDVKIIDNENEEQPLRQVPLDITKLRSDAVISQIADGVLTSAGWMGSLGSDAVMASIIAKMRAQMAGIATASTINPYKLLRTSWIELKMSR